MSGNKSGSSNRITGSKRSIVGNRKRGEMGIGRKNSGKRLCVVLTWAIAVSLLTGCRLAREEAETQRREEDRLVGVFVTEEHLDTGGPEVTINSRGELSFVENKEGIPGRIVPDENGWQKIIFESLENVGSGDSESESTEIKGFGIYDIRVWEEGQEHYTLHGIMDGIFSDVYWATNGGDNFNSNTVEATIYVEPGGPEGFYFNPVYQTARGDIYMQPGNGLFSSERSEGMSETHTMSWKGSIVLNGQETAEESSFAINITCAVRPTAYRLLLMGEDSQIIKFVSGDELAEMWDNEQWELSVPAETAYLILEQEKDGGETGRVFCNKGEKSLEFLRSAGGGYLEKRLMSIIWE